MSELVGDPERRPAADDNPSAGRWSSTTSTDGRHVVTGRGEPRASLLAIAILSVIAALTAGWGVVNTQDLDATKARLETTQSQLWGAYQAIDSMESEAAATTAQNAQMGNTKDRISSRIAELDYQVSRQTDCISALEKDFAELQRIHGLARVSTIDFNTSPIATDQAALGAALASTKAICGF